jgi:biopolymer transport protein ExbD
VRLEDIIDAHGLEMTVLSAFPSDLLMKIKKEIQMKKIVVFIILAAFFGSAFLLACGDGKESEKPKVEVTSQDVKNKAKEAIETAKTYTLQQKEEYQKQMEARLQELDREIRELQAGAQSKATALKEESKAQFDQALEELRNKQQAAADKLDKLKSSSGKAWEDMKSGMDSAMGDLSKAFDKARSHFD